MPTPLEDKSSPDEIRRRFDNDVERFSQLKTGQTATIDAPLAMELITSAAIAATTPIQRVLDIGCGAGNNTLKLSQTLGRDFDIDLVDLSQPMLDRAVERLQQVNNGAITVYSEDFRSAELPTESFDVILAAAVLHHLRDESDWLAAFTKIFQLLKPGGSVWITDLVAHETGPVQELMWKRYGDYLTSLNGEDYRDQVFACVDQEDSPRPVTWQLDRLKQVGFSQAELLHKTSCFAAFGAIKGY